MTDSEKYMEKKLKITKEKEKTNKKEREERKLKNNE